MRYNINIYMLKGKKFDASALSVRFEIYILNFRT